METTLVSSVATILFSSINCLPYVLGARHLRNEYTRNLSANTALTEELYKDGCGHEQHSMESHTRELKAFHYSMYQINLNTILSLINTCGLLPYFYTHLTANSLYPIALGGLYLSRQSQYAGNLSIGLSGLNIALFYGVIAQIIYSTNNIIDFKTDIDQITQNAGDEAESLINSLPECLQHIVNKDVIAAMQLEN